MRAGTGPANGNSKRRIRFAVTRGSSRSHRLIRSRHGSRLLGRGGDIRTGGVGRPMARRTALTSSFNRRAISFFGTPSTRCVDWGSQKHQACVLDAAGKLLGEREFEHGGAGLSQMADWLLSFAAGDESEVGVAVETPSGPVVESLMERDFVVHSINPKQLDRFRDRMSPAGAKDDRRDARVLASALRTDPHCLRQLEPTDPAIIELREWSRLDEDLTRERVRLGNRMRQQLWRYYPQFLDAVDDDCAFR